MCARLLTVSMAVLAAACGCAATPTPTPGMAPAEPPAAEPVATATTEVRLQVGESAPVDGEGFQVTFDAVEGDSRCAKGETCVWEGSATVRLSLTGAAGNQSMALQTSRRAGPDAAAYGDWAIRVVALEPVPVRGRAIAPSAYVVTLRIERGAGDPATLP
jgi:hypothetical protein